MMPMTLFQPMHRLREWCRSDEPREANLTQVQADALHVLDRHDLLHRIGDEREKHIWYQQGTEGNGNVDISWRERAEEMETRLAKLKTLINTAAQAGSNEVMGTWVSLMQEILES